MSFTCITERTNDTAVLVVSGRLISPESCDLLKQAADAEIQLGGSRIVVDMSGLEFMNSSGLNALIGILTRSRNAGGELVLCSISAKVRDLFIMTKLINVFQIKASREEALLAVKEPEQEA